MVDLLSLQQEIHACLAQIAPCFLRVSSDDCAIWVSDLSRKPAFSADAMTALSALPLSLWVDENSRLMYIDFSPASYAEFSEALPYDIPAFPENDELLPLYNLCRFLLRHPADLAQQPMELNRRILKLLFYPHLYKETEIETIYSECARRLRRKIPLPYLGGCLLAARLSQKGDFPCCSNI